IIDLDEISVPRITTDDLNVNHDISLGGLINGVDVTEIGHKMEDMVTKSGEQTISGQKTYTNNFIVKHPSNATQLMFLPGTASSHQAKMYLLSDGDNVSEINFGGGLN